MTVSIGSIPIKEIAEYGIFSGSEAIDSVYKGKNLLYKYVPGELYYPMGTTLQPLVIPAGVHLISVDLVGSRGYRPDTKFTPGLGGRTECDMAVTPGETLYITVGSIPTSNTNSYNAADIRTNNAGVTDSNSLNSRLVVAGGGGSVRQGTGGGTTGAGGGGGNDGATGGTAAGGTGSNNGGGGGGGTQTSGGGGGGHGWFGTNGNAGTFGLGGSPVGGAGGAGWYGGGSGSEGHYAYWEQNFGGGGGGSSYCNATRCSETNFTRGWTGRPNGDGYCKIYFKIPNRTVVYWDRGNDGAFTLSRQLSPGTYSLVMAAGGQSASSGYYYWPAGISGSSISCKFRLTQTTTASCSIGNGGQTSATYVPETGWTNINQVNGNPSTFSLGGQVAITCPIGVNNVIITNNVINIFDIQINNPGDPGGDTGANPSAISQEWGNGGCTNHASGYGGGIQLIKLGDS